MFSTKKEQTFIGIRKLPSDSVREDAFDFKDR